MLQPHWGALSWKNTHLPLLLRLHFLLCVMRFQWALMELALRFGDNVSWCNSQSLNSGLYLFQVCSSRAFSACRDHSWKSMILKTHLREVRQYIPPFMSEILISSSVTTEGTSILLQVKIHWLMTKMSMISTQWLGCWSCTSEDWRTLFSQRNAS